MEQHELSVKILEYLYRNSLGGNVPLNDFLKSQNAEDDVITKSIVHLEIVLKFIRTNTQNKLGSSNGGVIYTIRNTPITAYIVPEAMDFVKKHLLNEHAVLIDELRKLSISLDKQYEAQKEIISMAVVVLAEKGSLDDANKNQLREALSVAADVSSVASTLLQLGYFK